MLYFTDNAPTVAGWYWIDRPELSGVSIVWVGIRPGHKYLAICEEFSGKRDFLHVRGLHARWAGPIPPPRDQFCEQKPT